MSSLLAASFHALDRKYIDGLYDVISSCAHVEECGGFITKVSTMWVCDVCCVVRDVCDVVRDVCCVVRDVCCVVRDVCCMVLMFVESSP